MKVRPPGVEPGSPAVSVHTRRDLIDAWRPWKAGVVAIGPRPHVILVQLVSAFSHGDDAGLDRSQLRADRSRLR